MYVSRKYYQHHRLPHHHPRHPGHPPRCPGITSHIQHHYNIITLVIEAILLAVLV